MTWLDLARAAFNLAAIVGVASAVLLACDWLFGRKK
jgi:hypothetical protein